MSFGFSEFCTFTSVAMEIDVVMAQYLDKRKLAFTSHFLDDRTFLFSGLRPTLLAVGSHNDHDDPKMFFGVLE